MTQVKGFRGGLKESNLTMKRAEPLVTVKQLKEQYMFGIRVIDRENNEELSDEAYQGAIDRAVSIMEHDLDISINPVRYYDDGINNTAEYKDYSFNNYVDFSYLQLDNIPVISVESLEFTYMKDPNLNDMAVMTIPNNWIRLDAQSGIIRLIPNASFPANLAVGSTAAFFPEILRSSNIPSLWKIQYTAGFKDGLIPVALNMVIAYIAAIQILMLAGELVFGAGVANFSTSLDGLSQSLGTTASAENSAYSAAIKMIRQFLFGENEAQYSRSIVAQLRNYYRGETFSCI